jgi:Fe2+ transport system protein FeoA
MKLLIELREGEEAVVREVMGGRGAVRNLAELGIYPGKKIKVIRNRGALIVSVNGSSFVIGRGLAAKVVVDGKQV